MAATGYTPISLYYSTTASAVPTAGNLANGELALNIADMKLYAKNSSGVVTLLASNASTTGVDSLSFGSTGLTPSTATTGAITVAGTLNVANGGTGQTTFTAGRLLYGNGTSGLNSSSLLTFDGSQLLVNSNSTTASGFFQINDATTTQANSFGTIVRNANDGNGRYSLSAWRAQNASGLTQYGYIGVQSIAGASTYSPELVFGLSTGASTFAEQGRWTTTGLGIGTSSVTEKLTVQSTGNTIGSFQSSGASYVGVQASNSSQAFSMLVRPDVSNALVFRNETTGSNFLTLTTAGNLGIAYTTTYGKLSINSNGAPASSGNMSTGLTVGNGSTGTAINIGTYDAGSYNYIQSAYVNSAGTARALAFFLGSTQAMTLSAAGGLSVGTTADPGAGAIYATGNITAYYSSDIKFKENVRDIPDALATVNAIGGKLFDWTDEYIESKGGADGYFVQKADFGVVAQDVQKVFPIAVRIRPDGSLAVDYEKLGALAFAAVGELTKRVEALEAN